MKVTVYGGTNNKTYTPHQMAECEKLGKYLGENGHEILTGGCKGFPYYVGKAAISHGAKTVKGFTPAKNLNEHKKVFNFPTDGVTDLVFMKTKCATQSEAFMRRSLDMTPYADVSIAMGGSWGTFAEILFSFMFKQTIILVEEFDGAVTAFENAHEFFGKRDINPAVHNGAKLIRVKSVDEAIENIIKLSR
jgi:predicted Rossmann-fold nucleotide-binding protein